MYHLLVCRRCQLDFGDFVFLYCRWDMFNLFRRQYDRCLIFLCFLCFFCFFTGGDWRLYLCAWGCWRWRWSCSGSSTGFAFLLHSLRIALFHHVPENLFRNPESTIQFSYGLRGQNHINEYIQAITVMLDGIGQPTTPPLIYLDNLSTILGDNLFDTFQNCACLLFSDFGLENEP